MKYDLSNNVDLISAETYFKNLIKNKDKIELKKVSKTRSLKINKYLHVCITLFAIEYGYTLDEAKTLLKRLCNFMVYEKEGYKFLKKTSKMNNEECSKFVEWIRNYASLQGFYIPTSEEYLSNKFSIDKEIDKHKSYL